MADPPEFDALAKRFLDLWEQQASAFAADPDVAAAMAAILDPANLAGLRGRASGLSRENAATGTRKAASQDRAEAAHHSSRERDDDLVELARRVAACEERIAALEARARKKGASAPAKSRRRGSR